MAGEARTAGEDYSLFDALTLRGLLLHRLVNGNTLRAWQNIHIGAAAGLSLVRSWPWWRYRILVSRAVTITTP